MAKLFGVETLKDEVHEALAKALIKLQILESKKREVIALQGNNPQVYIALATLAHQHGYAALYEGLKVFWALSPATDYLKGGE